MLVGKTNVPVHLSGHQSSNEDFEDVVAQFNEALSADESLRLDREFHTLLAHAAQNPLLVTLSEMTSEWTSSLRVRSHADT